MTKPKSRTTPEDRSASSTLFVNSLEKGLRVLEAFDDDHPTLGISEIAEVTGMDKSAAQRFSNTLHQLGYLEKSSSTRRYRPSRKLMKFSFTYLRHSHLAAIAVPRMIEAGGKHKTTVNLAEWEGLDIVYTIRIPHVTASYVATVPGRFAPVWRTAAGLCVLSRLPEEEVVEILDQAVFTDLLPTTMASVSEVLEALERARGQGFAITYGQSLAREISVAAPIVDHRGRPVGAIQLPVYTPNWSIEEAHEKLAPLAVEVARSVSGALIAREGRF